MTSGRKRILIIDDDLHVLFMWRAALAHIPHQWIIDTAQGGCEALDKMAALGTTGGKAYDLIVTDPVIPNMNGQDFTHTIRTLYGHVPVVWITSDRRPDTDAKAQKLGVYCCLDKPISLALLRQVVWEALESTNL